jgi:hypothetical protein
MDVSSREGWTKSPSTLSHTSRMVVLYGYVLNEYGLWAIQYIRAVSSLKRGWITRPSVQFQILLAPGNRKKRVSNWLWEIKRTGPRTWSVRTRPKELILSFCRSKLCSLSLSSCIITVRNSHLFLILFPTSFPYKKYELGRVCSTNGGEEECI